MQRTILGPGRRGGSWPSWVTEAQAEFDGIFHSSDYNRTVSYDSLIRHVHLNTRGQIFCCATLATAIPELNIRAHYGPGYRVYYGELERAVVILLCGGTKRSQSRDIERAKAYWQDLRSRSNE